MSRYAVDDEVFEDVPVPREAPLQKCRHCTRDVTTDGYGGLVHADDYKYQCDPREKNSTMAEVKHGR